MSEAEKYLNAKRPHTSGEAPSIALHVQNSLRKYQMERKIFEELLELKRQQIRAGRANEQLLVKRMSDKYDKTVHEIAGLKNYDGPFTFKEFEKYLYSKKITKYFQIRNVFCTYSSKHLSNLYVFFFTISLCLM